MPRLILFAVGQAGSADYLIPLWRRWLKRDRAASWRVIASSTALARIAASGLTNVPLLRGDVTDAERLSDALGEWKPDLIFNSASGAAVEVAALEVGRRMCLPIVSLIDTWYGYRRRLERDGMLDLSDKILVIDDEAKREAIGEGLPPPIIEPVGHPAWEETVLLPQADRRHVLFVSQPVARRYGQSLGYTEVESWRLLHETAVARPDLIGRLAFAPHPDDDVPPPAEDALVHIADGHAGLAQAGTVVGMFSSLMTEAFLAGRHVISLQPAAQGRDMNMMSRKGLVSLASSGEDLVAALTAPASSAKELYGALRGSCDRLERALLAV